MYHRLPGGAAALVVAGLVAGAPASAQAPAGDERAVPLEKVFPYYDKYLKLPAADRTRWTLAYRLTTGGKPASGVRMWYLGAGNARTPVTIGADGRVEPMPTLAQLERKEQAVFAAPKGTRFGVQMDVAPRMAPAARMDARELAAAADQATRGAKKAAGVAGLVVPKFERVFFPGAAGGQVETPSGVRPLPATKEGKTLYFDPAAWPGATAVVFQTAPARVLLGPAK